MTDRVPLSMLQRLAANSGWNCAGQAIPMLVALATAPQLVRLLGVERFGLLGIIWAVLGYLGIFELGIGRALTQSISRRRESHRSGEVWVGLLALTSIGLLVALLVGVFAHWFAARAFHLPPPLSAEVHDAFLGVALAMPFVLVSTGLRGILEAHGQFRVLSMVRSTAGSLMFLGPWTVCMVQPSLSGVVGVLLITRAATFAVLLRMCLRRTEELRWTPCWSTATLSRLLGFGGWVTVSQLVGSAWGLADRMLLGMLASPSAVAYYVTPNEIISRFGLISNSLATAVFPDFARAGASTSRASGLFLSATRWLFWSICPISLLVAAAGPQLLRLWLGPVFAREAGPLLPWLIAYLVLNSFLAIPVAFLQARDRPQVFAKFQVAELALVPALLGAGIVHSGALGAAIVMVVRVAVETVFLTMTVSRDLTAVSVKMNGLLALFAADAVAVLVVGSLAGLQERMAAVLPISLLLIASSELLVRRAHQLSARCRFPLQGNLGESQ
ncbi:MAG: flippase [Bryobacteraceae bacterium]